jgi:tetratricopeptide (TPR) repeat protein
LRFNLRFVCAVGLVCAASRLGFPAAANEPLCAQIAPTSTLYRNSGISTDSAITIGDSLYRRGDAAGALAVYQDAIGAAPDSPSLAWRASRAALAIGWMEPNEEKSIRRYGEAQRYALRAVTLAPTDTNALLWLAVSKGRQAQVDDDPRTVVRLAREAHDVVVKLLAIDSTNAAAHNFLGQLHYQVMKTPWLPRMIAMHLLGGVHFEPSWAVAEAQLTRAVELDPDAILFRLELGRYYARRGNVEQARVNLRKAASLPRRHPQDVLLQHEAQSLLDGLRG